MCLGHPGTSGETDTEALECKLYLLLTSIKDDRQTLFGNTAAYEQAE